ncbi:FAD:protein FMN transferase [Aeromicrobium ginsengisoli]|uniref:FAD:protein FMN transferase n=1 Tax=Aeromicrobium ginsengisoli TaxID=363867 RepID=A0A5M4FAR5_9ACTN|nr:FAD:protein FMN transferase [Aeromicrobium ginsengisoli]KAA1395431.1 FAD:protein FMN transferase [Aeromicrobium ginsengisoli]
MPRPEPAAWRFAAIGTAWQIDTAEPIARDVAAAVTARIDDFDAVWSRFRSDSVVSRIAVEGGTWVLDPDSRALLDLYVALHEVTDGAVTPLVGRTLADLGYDETYSLRPVAVPAAVPAWDSIEWSYPSLVTREPVLLDVGAAGKGHLVDLVAGVLMSHGAEDFTIDASGDLLHRLGDPLRVALEHPGDVTRAIGIAELSHGQALCASATNRRAWGDGLHHVLDGRTGRPTRDIVATWVVADSCLLADGLATAHFLADPARLVSRFDHEFVRMHADGRVEQSPNFPGEVFS